MATLMLGTVYEETKHKYQLKLLAGAEGLHRSLRWLYFSEDFGNADFLRGGELMVITGFGLQGGRDLADFLRMLISKNCCGVIINVGKYIMEEAIPTEVLTLCNENQFPIITMPWRYHLTDIIQEYSRQIFFRTHEQDRVNDILQLLLSDRRLCSAEDEGRLMAHHFDPEGVYCAARLSWCAQDGTILKSTLPRDLHVLTENHLNQTKAQTCAFLYQDQLVLVFHDAAESAVETYAAQIIALCEAAFLGVSLRCGVGSALSGLTQLRESYQRAGLALLRVPLEGKHSLKFADLGIVQLFHTCRDAAVLAQFGEILVPLRAYDAQYDSQLLETLRLYLRFSGSVNLVSDEMYCHRNTTNYRIKKIKALLGLDLDRREVLFQLQLAFHLWEYERVLALHG